MNDALAARRARKGFFASKAIAARSSAAAEMAPRPHGAVPAGRFPVQIEMIPGSSTSPRKDGSLVIRDAVIVDATTGCEIDGARIVVRGAVAAHLAADPQMHDAPIEGFAVADDDGYELVAYDGSIMTAMAA